MARRQLQIAGTEAPTIEEIDTAAEEYRVFRDERMALAKKESEARGRLLETMKKHNLEAYKYDDAEGKPRKVSLLLETKVKVKRLKEEEHDGSDVEDGGTAGGDDVTVQ